MSAGAARCGQEMCWLWTSQGCALVTCAADAGAVPERATAIALVEGIRNALAAHDMVAAVDILMVLARVNPEMAEHVKNLLEIGIELSKAERAS